MNYEIESALRNKAETYQIHSLESEIRELSSKVNQLTDSNRELYNRYNNQNENLNTLVNALIMHNEELLGDSRDDNLLHALYNVQSSY